jgi:hypothetical protein
MFLQIASYAVVVVDKHNYNLNRNLSLNINMIKSYFVIRTSSRLFHHIIPQWGLFGSFKAKS